MDIQDFAKMHLPALEADEVRYNVQIAVLTAAVKNTPAGFAYWTVGAPGHCAIRSPGRAILLGNLNKTECHKLANETTNDDNAGVVGADETAHWFVEQAKSAGMNFETPIPQRIHVLTEPARHPTTPGSPRVVTAADAPLLFEWLTAFHQEAVPHDPPTMQEHADKSAASGRYLFWSIDDQPVSMAAISRRLKRTAAIAPVYTPPRSRGRGYAGSVTAAVVDRIFAEGRATACLYTDLRNPMSNRCYAKIGFKPYCDSWHYVRAPEAPPATEEAEGTFAVATA
jgi:RimJ/RimL family protein N-acetyltransferase